MTRKTHIAAGAFVSLPFIAWSDPISALGVVGAVAPDIDIKIPGVKHRGITHTLICLVGSTIAIEVINEHWALTWLLGYTSHLLLDSCTKVGVPLLYPFSKKNFGLKLFTTGKKVDKCLGYLFNTGNILYALTKLASIL